MERDFLRGTFLLLEIIGLVAQVYSVGVKCRRSEFASMSLKKCLSLFAKCLFFDILVVTLNYSKVMLVSVGHFGKLDLFSTHAAM